MNVFSTLICISIRQCSSQLVRARLFWTQRVQYFATKHQVNSSDQSMNELTLVVKYFYLFVLCKFIDEQKRNFIQLIFRFKH